MENKPKQIYNANLKHYEKLTKLDKLALFVTKRIGTMSFFLIIFTWTAFWILWNTISPDNWHFDPYPAFVLWLFVSNMIQILLMPLIMISQNLQSRHSEAKAEVEFEVNVKAEQEIETLLNYLKNQNKLMQTILERLDNKK